MDTLEYFLSIALACVALVAGWVECTNKEPNRNSIFIKFGRFGENLSRVNDRGWFLFLILIIITISNTYITSLQDKKREQAMEDLKAISNKINATTNTINNDISRSVKELADQTSRLDTVSHKIDTSLIIDDPIWLIEIVCFFFPDTDLDKVTKNELVATLIIEDKFHIESFPYFTDDPKAITKENRIYRLYTLYPLKNLIAEYSYPFIRDGTFTSDGVIGEGLPWKYLPHLSLPFSVEAMRDHVEEYNKSKAQEHVYWEWNKYKNISAIKIGTAIEGPYVSRLKKVYILFNKERYFELDKPNTTNKSKELYVSVKNNVLSEIKDAKY